MKLAHKNSAERWYKFSLAEQMANIGSEVSRALYWQEKNNQEQKDKSFWRSLELIDLTLSDPKHKNRLKEILRLREVICDLFIGKNEFKILPEQLKKYFLEFGLAARR